MCRHPKVGSALAFFDCHVNQARRVREAYERGFRWLIFDDNAPADRLYGYGLPGLPTIDMVLDTTLIDGDVLGWTWRRAGT